MRPLPRKHHAQAQLKEAMEKTDTPFPLYITKGIPCCSISLVLPPAISTNPSRSVPIILSFSHDIKTCCFLSPLSQLSASSDLGSHSFQLSWFLAFSALLCSIPCSPMSLCQETSFSFLPALCLLTFPGTIFLCSAFSTFSGAASPTGMKTACVAHCVLSWVNGKSS